MKHRIEIRKTFMKLNDRYGDIFKNIDSMAKYIEWLEDMYFKGFILRENSHETTTYILRKWDREKIVKFAKHLLGDECQKCKKLGPVDNENTKTIDYDEWIATACSNFDKCHVNKNLHCYTNKPCFQPLEPGES